MNTAINLLKKVSSDFVSLLYPHFCPGCHDVLETNEEIICTTCRVKLPRTGFLPHTENQVEKLFWGKVQVESAVAFLQFHKSSIVKNLMHELKYKGTQEVGEILGRICAAEYLKTDFFNEIDVIVPVPLHPLKLKKRGYNQCDSICDGISQIANIQVYNDGLVRNRANATQTKKSRFDRWKNTKELFSVQRSGLTQKHVLLVDDVVTTGSTLEACAHALLANKNKVSILSLACPID